MNVKHARSGVLILAFVAGGTAHAADLSNWAASYDPSTKTRFIPLELWTGGEWNGSRELRMTSANLSFGKRGEKRIVGPVAWKRPGSGETMQVYERDNRGKKQLFALSSRSDGLGRVFDSRYARDCVDEVKFPLGLWKEGETRVFDVSCNNGNLRRKIELTIEKADFSYEGVPHSLQFHWVVDGGRGRGTDMRYVYSPGRGLASVDED
jgi:hypothetical protein